MTTSTFYFNLVKFLTMAFVLGFCAYVVHAGEAVIDVSPFQTCTDCMAKDQGDASVPGDHTDSGKMISVVILNPDLSEFDSVQLAVVEIADFEIVADYLSYSLKDINNDGKTDMVFYFSYNDLMPQDAESNGSAHDACLFVDIMRKDKSIRNFNLCEHGFVIVPAGVNLI